MPTETTSRLDLLLTPSLNGFSQMFWLQSENWHWSYSSLCKTILQWIETNFVLEQSLIYPPSNVVSAVFFWHILMEILVVFTGDVALSLLSVLFLRESPRENRESCHGAVIWSEFKIECSYVHLIAHAEKPLQPDFHAEQKIFQWDARFLKKCYFHFFRKSDEAYFVFSSAGVRSIFLSEVSFERVENAEPDVTFCMLRTWFQRSKISKLKNRKT